MIHLSNVRGKSIFVGPCALMLGCLVAGCGGNKSSGTVDDVDAATTPQGNGGATGKGGGGGNGGSGGNAGTGGSVGNDGGGGGGTGGAGKDAALDAVISDSGGSGADATGDTASGQPTPGKLFVYAQAGINVLTYSVDRATGALTKQGAALPALADPIHMQVGAGQKFLAAACAGTPSGIHTFSINQTTGELKSVGTATADGAVQIGLHPSGRFAATASYGNTATVYAIAQDGTPTKLQTVTVATANTHSATFGGLGKSLYVASAAGNKMYQFSFDDTNATAPLKPLDPAGVAFVDTEPFTGKEPRSAFATPDGKFLYVMGQATPAVIVYQIGSTGGLTKLGQGVPALKKASNGQPGKDILIDASGKHLYASVYEAGQIASFDVAADGSVTLKDNTPTLQIHASQMAIDPAGQFLFVTHQTDPAGQIGVYRIDAQTGGLTLLNKDKPTTLPAGDAQAIVAVNLPSP